MQDTQQLWSSATTIVIAELNQLGCQLITSAFRSRRTHISVLASTVGAREALALLERQEPDVAVISAQLEEGPLEGYRVLRELRLLQVRTRAILLLGSRERDLIIDAFRCGARGVVFRDERLETLGKCIRAVHGGQVWASSEHLGYLLDDLGPAMPSHLQDARGIELLSKREGEVVRLVSEGLTNRAISAHLGLSEHTVRNYLFRVFDKLGVSTRVELVLYFFQNKRSGAVEAGSAPGDEPNGRNVPR
ncbi:MAG TPA: response regulator transcription factor [Candidatus Acidoferrales bacterium]|nr:response regulator transcription factor [Candidatus Acidoferrales bacterium]